jgi:ribosomal protein L11 methyltransferase
VQQNLVIGIDIDHQAVQAAKFNAQKNQLDNCQFYQTDDEIWLQQKNIKFDIVVANILANPLKVLAELLCSKVKIGGIIILSGILERQAEDIKQAYSDKILLKIWNNQEGWVCMLGNKINE